MKARPIVLFLCTGKSCRSQMAEGFRRHLGGDRFEARSAGTEPAERVHPLAIEVMVERGIDISGQRPTAVGEYLGRLPVRHLLVVCDSADKEYPRALPGVANRIVWPFEDPASCIGTPADVVERFRGSCAASRPARWATGRDRWLSDGGPANTGDISLLS